MDVAQATSYQLRDPSTGSALLVATETLSRIHDVERRETMFANGSDLAVQREVFESTAKGVMQRYAFDDPSTGESIDVVDNGTHWLVSYRESTAHELETARLKKSERTIHGKAIPQLILRQWQALAAGKTVTFDLIVPQRLTTYDFRIRREAGVVPPSFVVDANNWLIRQFAPTLKFTFADESSGRIARFDGPAAARIGTEKHRRVRIEFAEQG